MKQTFLLIIFSILFCFGCTDSVENSVSSDDRTQEEYFWDWFQEHSNELYAFENNQEALFDQLKFELNKIDENLMFEFGNIQEDNTRNFVISADGISSSFPSVEGLCEVAPQLEKWVVIPFRPRVGMVFGINYGGIELNGEDLKFSYVPSGDRVDIELFIPNYDLNDERYIGAGFVMLDNAVGEYDVETKIGEILFSDMPADTSELLPFSELPNVIDNY